MRLWRVVLLLNLAVALGLLLGWLAWGRESVRLERELAESRRRVVVVGREQTWQVTGVVRAVVPDIGLIVLTHGEIAGFMPAGMTMGFKVAQPGMLRQVEAGDVVRFTLKGIPPDVQITSLVKEGKS